LIGASAHIFEFTSLSFSFFRAGLQDIDHAPQLTPVAEALHQLFRGTGKPQSREIHQDGPGPHTFEYVYPGIAHRAENIRFAQRYFLVGQFADRFTLGASYVQLSDLNQSVTFF